MCTGNPEVTQTHNEGWQKRMVVLVQSAGKCWCFPFSLFSLFLLPGPSCPCLSICGTFLGVQVYKQNLFPTFLYFLLLFIGRGAATITPWQCLWKEWELNIHSQRPCCFISIQGWLELLKFEKKCFITFVSILQISIQHFNDPPMSLHAILKHIACERWWYRGTVGQEETEETKWSRAEWNALMS